MEFLDALLFAILAGFVNGSYAMPRKYLTKWPDANKWFVFSFFGFLIVPLITTYFLNHNSLAILLTAPTNILAVLFIGGILFGIGMVLFTLSLNAIGMGVAFTLNISLGTIGGSLLPLFVMEPARILTIFGLLECSALILFVSAVLISSRAVKLRDLYKSSNEPIAVKNVSGKKVTAGILFGVFSGIFCSLQGFAYAYSLPVINNLALRVGASELAAANIPWIAIFTSAFIPYMLYQLYLMKKDSTINALTESGTGNYWLIILGMGVLYFISLILYSKSAQALGHLGTVIAWPLLMIFIILTSNFWGLVQGEWSQCGKKAGNWLALGLTLQVCGIGLLSASAYLNQG